VRFHLGIGLKSLSAAIRVSRDDTSACSSAMGAAIARNRSRCHSRHGITAALDVAGKAGIGLDKAKAHSRHAAIGTLLSYADEHDRQGTQRTLADLVAGELERL
jgi:hypothetical protein